MFIENSSFNMDKGNVYQTIRKEIDFRIFKLQQALKSQKESLSSASESTAGDKHNTSRAMMHMEEEKLGQQMIQLEQLKRLIQKINPENTLLTIGLGSLVKTNRGWLYIAVPLGKIMIQEQELMAISLASPIGQALKEKKVGESTKIQGIEWEIHQIS